MDDKRWMYILGGGFIGAVLGLVALLFFVEIPAGNKDMVNSALGMLVAGCTGILGYFYGSSKGSAAKDSTIAGLVATESDSGKIAEKMEEEE